MAFVTLNGYDVEHASSMLVYENLFPEIQHINGKGVVDKYTMPSDVESVTYIDVMRVLPYAPRFRKLGGLNNEISQFWRLEVLGSRCWQFWFLPRLISLAYKWTSFCCIPSWLSLCLCPHLLFVEHH